MTVRHTLLEPPICRNTSPPHKTRGNAPQKQPEREHKGLVCPVAMKPPLSILQPNGGMQIGIKVVLQHSFAGHPTITAAQPPQRSSETQSRAPQASCSEQATAPGKSSVHTCAMLVCLLVTSKKRSWNTGHCFVAGASQCPLAGAM